MIQILHTFFSGWDLYHVRDLQMFVRELLRFIFLPPTVLNKICR